MSTQHRRRFNLFSRTAKVNRLKHRLGQKRLFIEPLEVRRVLAAAFPEFIDPNPAAGNQFGQTVVPLSTGNVVITSPFDDAGGTDAGAVYLFNGATGALINTLRGTSANDNVGHNNFGVGGVTALTNGNFVVSSPTWDLDATNTNAGAYTFANGVTGFPGAVADVAVVSATNSLVGSRPNDSQFGGEVTPLTNGNYVVTNNRWDLNASVTNVGAATWGSGTTGVTGSISIGNSLIGSTSDDVIGLRVTALTNGNYVVSSSNWTLDATHVNVGAATWGNGTTGIQGAVTSGNSLVGSRTEDFVGSMGVVALTNGNYVVRSEDWDLDATNNDVGAVTFGNGTTGITGAVTSGNSLVGSRDNDAVGGINGSVTALPNGNYVVIADLWTLDATHLNVGAATFGNGTTGVSGAITNVNSLIGSTSDDRVGSAGLTVLTNGNYVVISNVWDLDATHTDVGAVTFGSGTIGVVGSVSAANSLVGSTTDDAGSGSTLAVVALTNGNYVVGRPNWDLDATHTNVGAATFANGTTGIVGTVTAANSLVGSTTGDRVGVPRALTNGNYVVASTSWDLDATHTNVGAATFANGTTGIVGPVTTGNSLVGSTTGDGIGGVTALTNGNYVVFSAVWDLDASTTDVGAVTFANGTTGITGPVTTANSLTGSATNHAVALSGVTALTNGNYVVTSPFWDLDASHTNVGAVTLGNGTTGTVGTVSSANSLVGSTTNDNVGGFPSSAVTALANGNFVVRSSSWDNSSFANAGAMSFGSGTTGVVGMIDTSNSAIGDAESTNLQPVVLDNVNNHFFGRFIAEGSGRVRLGSQVDGFAAFDFGDAPDTGVGTSQNNYQTTSADNGAQHSIVSGAPFLGTVAPDGDANGQPTAAADGDDLAITDDEDGVTNFAGATSGANRVSPGEAYSATVTVNGTGVISAWIDWNRDGDWLDANEQIITNQAFTTGSSVVNGTAPTAAVLGPTLIRVRVSTQSGLTPVGAATDGEVEDYLATIVGDYGDAPAPYPTTLAQDGARHKPALGFLGTARDVESNGQPNAAATGDDTNGAPDDEDGVVFPTLIEAQTATLPITITGIGGIINLWIDWNRDGDWTDTGEQALTNRTLTVTNGTQNVNISVPVGISSGTTGARVRYTHNSVTTPLPTGELPTGEVEDYLVTLQRGARDYGDAPDTGLGTSQGNYQTTAADGGASHITNAVFLGLSVDAEADGQPSASSNGDDTNGSDDEDGITLAATINRGQTTFFTVRASTNALLHAWIDVNRDGDWTDAGEQVLDDEEVSVGVSTKSFVVPENVVVGASVARFRITSVSGTSTGPTGDINGGEVEDYPVTIQAAARDFGDAADPGFPTLLASNGARHYLDGVTFLGALVDGEASGQPNAAFNGDDTNGGTDDEDGLTSSTINIGGLASFTVTASAAGFLNLWVDWNRDGDWNDADELFVTNRALTAGANNVETFVPASAVPGTAGARFRFTKDVPLGANGFSSVSPTGDYPTGEVEDHLVTILAPANTRDFGDAPFQTTLADNGPRHVATGPVLGASRDTESDGQPNATAAGDDLAGTDDEDGVSFGTLRQGRQTGVTIAASAAGKLDAFVDFNADGDFADSGEKIFDNLSVAAGTNSLSFRVPSTAADSSTFARIRISTAGGLSFNGAASDGEVEDYAVRIKQGIDLGDAPNTYATALASNGARHLLGSPLFLGTVVDGDSDGQPNATATGDDNNFAPDDEDGVTFGTLRQGRTTFVTVVASAAGKLDAFVDFNADGDFADTGEKIFNNLTVAAGTNSLAFRVPSTAADSSTFARFRISTAGGLTFNGLAGNGEVEDYAVRIKQGTDLGNAPNKYHTTLASNGARHLLGSPLFFGAIVDGDADGQFSATATGDDTSGVPDDEDGVTIGPLTQGTPATVTVVASAAGRLDAFLDFNADGDFADAGEKIFNNIAVLAGTNNLPFTVPLTATAGSTFARFRLSTAGGLSFVGSAVNGEVEDYQVTIGAALQAADGEASPESRVESQELDQKQLNSIVDAAIARLAAQGLSPQQLSVLSSLSFAVADLPGATLGLATSNAITLDATAAGYGWFVDPTPLDDDEFASGSRLSTLDSRLRMDLLTAVMHELGHTLGRDDLHDHGAENDLMYETLAVGVRRASFATAVDAVWGWPLVPIPSN